MASGGPDVTKDTLLNKIDQVLETIKSTVNPKLLKFIEILRKNNIELDYMKIPKSDRQDSIESILFQLRTTNNLLSMTETYFTSTLGQIQRQLELLSSVEKLSDTEKQILETYQGGDYPVTPVGSKLLGLALDLKKFELALDDKLLQVASVDVDELDRQLRTHAAELPAIVREYSDAYKEENDFDDFGDDLSGDEGAGSLDASFGSLDASFGSLDRIGSGSRPNVTAMKLTGFLALSSSREGLKLSFSSSDAFPDFSSTSSPPRSPRRPR